MALQWELPGDVWDDLDKTLTRLLDALRTRNLAFFREAADDLLFFGPDRDVTNVGDTVVEPTPPKICERLNTLIHTLSVLPPDLATPLAPQPGPSGQQ